MVPTCFVISEYLNWKQSHLCVSEIYIFKSIGEKMCANLMRGQVYSTVLYEELLDSSIRLAM